jgi:hypothetical protein
MIRPESGHLTEDARCELALEEGRFWLEASQPADELSPRTRQGVRDRW